MYDIIRLVIETGNYSLVELLKKIDTVWIQGDLTDDQRMGLITLARENADYTSEINLIEKVHDLEKRVKALEENDSTGDSEQYPEYTPGKWYYNGDKSHLSKNAINVSPQRVKYVHGIRKNIRCIGV